MYRVCLSPWTSVQIPSPGGALRTLLVGEESTTGKGDSYSSLPNPDHPLVWQILPPKYLETVEEVVPLFRNVSPLSVFPNGSLRDWAPPSIPLWLKKDTPPPLPRYEKGQEPHKIGFKLGKGCEHTPLLGKSITQNGASDGWAWFRLRYNLGRPIEHGKENGKEKERNFIHIESTHKSIVL